MLHGLLALEHVWTLQCQSATRDAKSTNKNPRICLAQFSLVSGMKLILVIILIYFVDDDDDDDDDVHDFQDVHGVTKASLC